MRRAAPALAAFALQHGFVIGLLSACLAFGALAPSFFSLRNVIDIFHVTAPMMIVASGVAMVIIAGQLDISVGSIAYVASSVFAIFLRRNGGSVIEGWLLALAVGAALGAINGFIILGLRVNCLIATLGTLIAFRGVGLQLTNGGLIALPDAVKPLGNLTFGGVYPDSIAAVVVVFLIHLLMTQTSFGRQLVAIGNDAGVARKLGVAVDSRIFASFMISALLATAAGVMYTMQVAVNTSKIGEGMEFSAIAAAVVGGISLFGGRGHLLSAVVLGSLTFQIISSGLQHIGANPYSYRLVEGAVIFVAMYLDAFKTRSVGGPAGDTAA